MNYPTGEQLKRVKVADLRTILNCLHSSKKTKKTSTPRMSKIQTIRRFISYQLTPANAPTPVRLAVTRSLCEFGCAYFNFPLKPENISQQAILATPSFSTGRIDGTKTRPKRSICKFTNHSKLDIFSCCFIRRRANCQKTELEERGNEDPSQEGELHRHLLSYIFVL